MVNVDEHVCCIVIIKTCENRGNNHDNIRIIR